ncbi:1,3-beta-glucanosyltransferase gel4 [Nannizzia gypsea CBS 118893]|uniref:1,3-beta-glucanosyltransferase n=1 Tax=Arthroderma gypseum (strain ATCC MYA-4604 / CBS 118893) TaxID=535722 RepID=E5QZJ8_ARTGP|nr:1,3-beta-glucanosyltransferase gel4 [Nannizzia gypsea CBS 118893]EFQ97364.1 1,3-beta-glucanosyltransferase gel4 [Nannizzia gypsea CBS 118893]
MKFSSLAAATALVAGSVVAADLDPIVIKGSKFFYKTNGTEFFMKGIAYQQEISSNGTTNPDNSYQDPLADVDACKRDIPLMQELQTNTIRVYAIDPKKDHKQCMKMLQDAGIYVVADLSEPKTSIIRDDPKWNDDLYERYTSVIDELAQYSNTIGFFAGNEVSNNSTNTDASAFVKAAVRDMKAYIKQKNYRPMGVGYATNDDAEIRDDMTAYFNCNKQEESIDFWGYNIYSWCGDSSYTTSGYDKVVEEFKSFNVPVFFAEYGCNKVQPRKFTEVQAIYGDKMTPVLSGGIVYMYFQEANDYGLVKIENDKPKKLADFNNLKTQISKAKPSGVKMDAYKPTNTALSTCPTSNTWKAKSSPLPPTPNKSLCSCMVKSLTCVANSDITDKELGKLFGVVCGNDKDACKGITADASKGVYGAYSMCSPKEQLSFAFDQYYKHQSAKGNGATACDFGGAASMQKSEKPSGNCATLVGQAGQDGTGSITSGPGGSSTSSGAAAHTIASPSVNFGIVKFGAYLFCAVLAGAGMILI